MHKTTILCQFGLFCHQLTTISPSILNHFWWELYQKKHAETMYKQLWNFMLMYGYYDSLLILLSPPPNNVISMTAKSIELFLLYKRQKAGTPLLDPSTQEPVNDIFRKPFVCDGTWRAPDSNKIFNAAIANLDMANNQRGVYHEACKD